MSNYVDERIVEMRFDNQNFEKNVQVSLKTLEELNKQLKLEDAGKSFENIQNASSKIDLSNLANNVQSVADRCSFLGIVGDEVIRRLTNGFLDLNQAVISTVKSLTIDQIGVGFDKYERKVQSVQTILNATGKSIDEVSAALDKLNWFTDETSYSYADMVDNISKFTSSSVDLDVAVTSMIGIADAAGLAGATVQDASHAMEGFSKAIAQGYMSRQNWQWIRTAHMDTTKFKDVLIQAAVAEGTLNDALDGTYTTLQGTTVSIADFETALKDGWMTTDVITSALNEFGGTTEKIYSEYTRLAELGEDVQTSKIIDSIGIDIEDLGLKSFRAAQEAKTFSDALNSVKDAVSTGWMVSFETIFGDYEVARHFWTDVANEMWDIFASSGEDRNDLLSKVFTGPVEELRSELSSGELTEDLAERTGQKLIQEIILNILGGIKDIQAALSEAFEGIFGGTDERAVFLYSIIETLHGLSERFRLTEESSENLRKTISGLLSIFKFFAITGERLLNILSPITNLFNFSSDSILRFSGNLGEAITEYVKWYENSEQVAAVTDKLRGYVERIVEVIRKVINFIKRLAEQFLPLIQNALSNIKKAISNSPIPGFLNRIKQRVRSLWNYIEKIDFESINIDLSGFSSFISAAADAILALYGAIRDYLTPYIDKAREAFSNFDVVLDPVREKINNFKQEIEESGGIIGYFSKKISEVREKISEFTKNGGLGTLFDSFVESLGPVKEKLSKFLEDVGRELENVDWGSVLAFSIGFSLVPAILSISAAFTEAAKLFKTGKGVLGTVNTILTKFKNGFKSTVREIGEAAVLFSVAIAVLAGAIWLLANKVAKEDLLRSVTMLVAVMGTFTIMVAGIAAAIHFLKIKPKDMLGILAFAAAIGVLAVSLKVLEGIKISWGQIISILGLMVAMAAAAVGLSTFGVKLDGVGIYFLTFAGAILILSIAMQKLGDIPAEKMNKSMKAITNLMIGLGLVTAVSRLVKGSSIGILALTGAVFLIIKLLEKLGDEKIKTLIATAEKNYTLIRELLLALLAMALLSRVGGKQSAAAGVGIALMAASLFIIVEAVKKFADIKDGALKKGLMAVGAVLVLYSLMAAASTIGKGNGALAGVGIAVMSASLLLVYFAVKQFATIDTGSLQKGLGAIMAVMAMYAVLLGMTALSGLGKMGPIIAMVIALGAVVAAIVVLTLYDYDQINKSITAIAVTFATLVAAMMVLHFAKIDTTTLIGLIAMIVALHVIAESLEDLAAFSWESLIASATAISGCLVAVVLAMGVLSTINFTVADILGSFAALAVGILAFWAIGAILKSLGEFSWSGHVATATAISEVLIAIAAAMDLLALIPSTSVLTAATALFAALVAVGAAVFVIGWMIDAMPIEDIADKFAKASEKLPTIGDNIKALCESLQGIPEVDPRIAEIFETVANGFATLVAAEFVDNIIKFINGGKGAFDDLGPNMEKFGNAMQTLSTALPTSDELDKITTAVDSVCDIAFAIEKFPKNTDWKKLNKNLGAFGEALYDYAFEVDGMNHQAVADSVNSVRNVVAIANMLPTTGGFIALFTGKTDWKGITNNLVAFGEAISGYGPKAAGINANKDAIADSVESVKNVTDIANMLPLSGGLIEIFTGHIDWEGITSNLNLFGSAISRYGVTVTDLAVDAIASSVPAVTNIISVAEAIINSSGFVQIANGQIDMKKFKEQIIAYGEGIRDFSSIATEIDYDSLSKASDLTIIGKNFGISIITGISGAESDIIKAVSDLINSAYDTANRKASSFYSIGSEIAKSIASGISSNLKSINESMGEYTKVISSEIDRLMAQIPSTIQNGEGNIINAVSVIIVSCVNTIRGSYQEIVYAASYLTRGFAEGFQAGAIYPGISLAMNDCIYTIKTYYYSFYSAGQYIVQGVADGVKWNTYIATDAVGYMCRRMEDTMRDYNEINSPSELYGYWAKFIPMGIAKGITDNSNLAEDAVSDMGYEMITAISPALAMLADLVSGDFEISPEIRPVVDLSEVYASAELINGIFADKNAEAANRASYISRGVSDVESNRYAKDSMDSQNTNRAYSPTINNYIYTQPGQDPEEIANEVERRMVRSFTQRKVAYAR